MSALMEYLYTRGVFGALLISAVAAAIYCAVRILYLRLTRKPRESVFVEIARGLLVWYLVTLVIIVWLEYLPQLVFGRLSAKQFAEWTFFRGTYVNNGRALRALRGDFSAFLNDEFVINIALFIPYGLLLPTAFRKLRWWAADLIALGTTLCIELFQPFFGRVCDLDDIIANTLGAVIGCGIAKLVLTLARKRE